MTTSIPVTITTETMVYEAILDSTRKRTAFVTGSVTDEATGAALPGATLRLDRDGASARVMPGGFFAVAGEIERLFPELAMTAYSLTLTFSAAHYKSKALTVAIPAGTSFPIAAGVVRLRPLPVRIEGRVTRESNRAPIPGASVAPAPAANVALLRRPAYMDHALTNLTPVTMTPAGGLRSLSREAPAGIGVVALSSVAGLGAGSILRVGDPPAVEYALLDGADATTSTVTLHHALWRSYPKLANVQAVTAMPAGAAVATARTIDAGEGLVLLAAPLGAAVVEISDAPHLEYHDTNLVADADGFFGADGIVGVSPLTLRATAGGFLPLEHDVPVDPGQPVIDVSYRLKT